MAFEIQAVQPSDTGFSKTSKGRLVIIEGLLSMTQHDRFASAEKVGLPPSVQKLEVE